MKLIPLSGKNGTGKFAKVDDEDYPILSRITWCVSSHGYAKNGRNLYMHKLVMGFPRSGVTDHADRDTLNNQKSNLRKATQQQNLMNRSNQRNKKTSKYKGVCLRNRVALSKPWIATITKTTPGIAKRSYSIGYFATEEEAARAYDAKAYELYGRFAFLNFPS